MGRTDKRLTSTLVIRIFLSFDLADIFLKYGSCLFFKKRKKLWFPSSTPTTTQTRPLDPARHDYAVSPPKRLHFLGLYPQGGITSVCGYSGENFPCSIHHLLQPSAFFCNIMDSDTHSWVSSRNGRVLPSQPSKSPPPHVFGTSETRRDDNNQICWTFRTHACKRRPYRPYERKRRKRRNRKTIMTTTRRKKR